MGQQCVQYSDCFRVEAVAESIGSGMDAPVLFARRCKSEDSIREE